MLPLGQPILLSFRVWESQNCSPLESIRKGTSHSDMGSAIFLWVTGSLRKEHEMPQRAMKSTPPPPPPSPPHPHPLKHGIGGGDPWNFLGKTADPPSPPPLRPLKTIRLLGLRCREGGPRAGGQARGRGAGDATRRDATRRSSATGAVNSTWVGNHAVQPRSSCFLVVVVLWIARSVVCVG